MYALLIYAENFAIQTNAKFETKYSKIYYE